MITLCLWLWGSQSGPPGRWDSFFKFDTEMVVRLADQIRKNLHVPHEIVVVTDRPADAFPSWMRHVDLVEHFGDMREMGGCWLRLKAFKPGMSDVLGKRVAWLDLDSVVTGDVTPIFDRPEPCVLYKSDSVSGQPWNGSLILFSPDDPANQRVWGEFDPKTCHAITREQKFRGTDQSWLAHIYGWGAPHWSWKDGVFYYNLGVGRRLPESARLIVFPGRNKPSDPGVRLRSPWLRELWPLPGESRPDVGPWPVRGPAPTKLKTLQDARRAARLAARATP